MKNKKKMFFCFILLLVSCKNMNVDYNESSVLPKPSGKYKTGTQILQLNRIINDSTGVLSRKLNIQLYYPTNTRGKTLFANYLYDTILYQAMGDNAYLNLTKEILNNWIDIKTHSILDAEIADDQFPLILFSHGFGMSRINYTSFAEELASHGYIVVTVDHPGSGFTVLEKEYVGQIPDPNGPDGKVIEFCKDDSFILDNLSQNSQLSEHIDKQRIGIMGHSLGGAAALNISQYDPRFSAAINLDSYPFGNIISNGIKIPFMAILQRPGGPIQISDSMRIDRKNQWSAIVHQAYDDSYVFSIEGFMHFDFSDLPFLIPDSLRVKNGGVLKNTTGFSAITSLSRSFFDHYLNKKPLDIKKEATKFNVVRDDLE